MNFPDILRDTLTCAITSRSHYGSTEADREAGLLRQTEYLARNGVSFIQLREKDLAPRDLLTLARAMLEIIGEAHSETRLLINAGRDCRADIAAAAGADGLHLASGVSSAEQGQLTASQARRVLSSRASSSREKSEAMVSISCHTLAEVQCARDNAADIILFGPVFGKFMEGKIVVPGTGLDRLAEACLRAGETPVLALGGVTLENVASCMEAGAKGIAAIRLFQHMAE